jgi:methylthioribose-1-phosphate isomerase
MELNEIIEKYFDRENVVEILTQYELYYQIALGNFVYETIQDIEETNKKIQELNLKPTPNVMLANTYDMFVHAKNEKDFENKLAYLVRYRAILHALKDFVNSDKELVQINDYIEEKTDLIVQDKYFTESMYLQYESSYASIHEYFDLLISEELALKLQETLQKSINGK